MEIIIPKRFMLLGRTIDVVSDRKLIDAHDAWGLAEYAEGRIRLQPRTSALPITQDDAEHTFFHELTHWILYAMNQGKLQKDERFVDLFGGLLHQALKTAEGTLKLT